VFVLHTTCGHVSVLHTNHGWDVGLGHNVWSVAFIHIKVLCVGFAHKPWLGCWAWTQCPKCCIHTHQSVMSGLDTSLWAYVGFAHKPWLGCWAWTQCVGVSNSYTLAKCHVLFEHFPILTCWFCTYCVKVLHQSILTCYADWYTRPRFGRTKGSSWGRGWTWWWWQQQWRWESFV
jgi:hypothetical protein